VDISDRARLRENLLLERGGYLPLATAIAYRLLSSRNGAEPNA
jgi:hypothetical protein